MNYLTDIWAYSGSMVVFGIGSTARRALELAQEARNLAVQNAEDTKQHKDDCIRVRDATQKSIDKVDNKLTDIGKFLGRIQIYLIAVLGSIVAYFLIHYVIERPVMTIQTTTETVQHDAPVTKHRQ